MTTKVIQADREAVAKLLEFRGAQDALVSNLMSGEADWHHAVKAFASHADPLRRALEKVRTMLFDEHAPLLNVAEAIDAALSSGENNNGE